MKEFLNYFKKLAEFDSTNILNMSFDIIQYLIILILVINIVYQIYLLFKKKYKKIIEQISLDILIIIIYFSLELLNKIILFKFNIKVELIIILTSLFVFTIYKIFKRIKYGSVIQKYDKNYNDIINEVLEKCDHCGLYFKPKKLKKQNNGQKLCKNCIKEIKKEKN